MSKLNVEDGFLLTPWQRRLVKDGIVLAVDSFGRDCSVCLRYQSWKEFNKGTGKMGHDHRSRRCLKEYRRTEAYKKANRERAALNYQDPVKRAKQLEAQSRYHSKPEIQAKLHSKEELVKVRERYKKRREKISQDPVKLTYFREVNKESQRRYMQDPKNKLSNRICCDIRKRLASRGISKKRQHWEDLVDYTVEDLKLHLESHFEPGMNWDNHGEWHLDHIIPVACFEFKSIEDEGFKKCWGLENLMPRWATTDVAKAHGSMSIGNINKGKKLIHM